MRIDRTFGSSRADGSRLNRIGGTSFSCTEISLARFGRRLPVRRKNGTPAQRQLSMKICSATKVSVRELGADAGLVAIAGHRLAEHEAGGILRAHHVRVDRRRPSIGRSDCRTSSFSSRIDVGVERVRRLHRDQRQELQHVVLHHVAQRARLFVVAGARADAFLLGHGDLHVVDVLLVEQRLEDAVGEPEHQDVLDGLLSQVVIDAVDLALVEHLRRSRR